MRFVKALVAAAATLMVATAVHASPIVNTNVRPVAIGATPGSEQSLQSVLNGVFGVGAVNATTNQSTAGQWASATSSATSIPTLIIEQTAGAVDQKFGIWFGNDSSNLFMLDLFFGGAVGGSTTLQQSAASIGIDNGVMIIGGGATFQSSCGTQINCGVFSNALINPSNFGFYFQTGSGKIAYSIDSMNVGGATDLLAYQGGTSTNWLFAFEDGTDNDYNDMVVKVESIKVPEPGTLALLGLGFAGLAAASRRKQKQA